MASNKEIDKAIYLTNLCLLMAGLNIKQNNEKSFLKDNIKYLFYIAELWLYTDVAAQILWVIQGIKAEKNFEELTYIAPCITVSLLGTSKAYFIKKHLHIAKDVLRKFYDLHPCKGSDKTEDTNNNVEFDEKITDSEAKITRFDEMNEVTNENNHELNKFNKSQTETKKDKTLKKKEEHIIRDSMTKLNLTTKFVFINCLMVVTAFSCMPIVFMAINYYKSGDTDIKYPLLCNYWFFENDSISTFIYFHHVVSVVIAAVNLYGTDSLFYAFCTFTQMHFRVLSIRMENVVCLNVVESKKRLSILVKRHQELIQIVNQIQLLYGKSTLVNFITSSFLICLSGFNVMTIKDVGPVVSFINFLFMSMVQVFMVCFCGDMVMRTSMDIGNSAYKCLWYNTDREFKKNIQIIIYRSQKPCKITAENFADLNLRAFTTVLSRSWSYFALLNTMYS